jgi:glycosyltransferase involved in cell wall biosynthesis
VQNPSIGQLILILGKDPVRELSGGHSSYARAHALAAVRAGYAPHLFCVGDHDDTETLPYGTLHRVRVPGRMMSSHAGLARIRSVHAGAHALWLVPAIRRLVAHASGPVVLHGIGTWGLAAVWAARSLRHAGREAASVVNSYTVHRAEYRSKFRSLGREHPFWARWHYGKEYAYGYTLGHVLERLYLRGADRLLVNYESVRRLIEGAHGAMPRLIQVPYASEFAFQDILPAPDPDFDAALRNLRPESAPLVVSVSRHDPRKGVTILLRALAELRRRGVAFRACVASGGELLEAHRALARSLSLDGQVALPGYVKDPRVCLNAADVFVLPSLEEHSGSVSLLEAMQAGRAIVTSGVDGMLEDIEDGVSGRFVPPGREIPLADTLAELLADPAQRTRLGREARRSFESRFSADVLARTLDGIYREFGLRPGGTA